MSIDLSFLLTLIIANLVTLFIAIMLIGRVLSSIVKRFMRQFAKEKVGTLAKQISNWLGIPEEWAQAIITAFAQYYIAPQQKKEEEKEKKQTIWA